MRDKATEGGDGLDLQNSQGDSDAIKGAELELECDEKKTKLDFCVRGAPAKFSLNLRPFIWLLQQVNKHRGGELNLL